MSGSMEGGVDASIPLQTGRGVAQQPNPLQTIGQFAQTQNALNTNKLFPFQLQQQQQAAQSGAVGLAQKIRQAAYQGLVPLLAGGPITHNSATTRLGALEAAGIPTAGVIQEIMAAGPQGDGPGFNDFMRALITSGAQMDPQTAVGMVTPQMGPTIQTGNAIQPTTLSPAGSPTPGQITPAGGSYTMGLTPGEAAQPVQVGTEAGTGRAIMAPLGSSPFGTGRYPGAPGAQGGAPGSAGVTHPAGAAPSAPAGIPMGLPVGEPEAMTAAAKPAGDAAGALGASANDIPMRQAQLTAMLGDLTNASTGPMTPDYSTVMGRLTQLGVAPPSGAQRQASRENFEKMASQFAQQQASKLGIITNDKLGTALTSNPNAAFTTLGNQGVIHILQGNEDALNAKNQAWQASGENPANFFKWSQQFNQNFDPRVFWYTRMAPTERRELYSGMSPQDQKKFQTNLDHAIGQGWVDPSQLQAAPQQ
jgi:hypothetical protein